MSLSGSDWIFCSSYSLDNVLADVYDSDRSIEIEIEFQGTGRTR